MAKADLLKVDDGKILFPSRLVKATIIDRPNRFIANVKLDGKDIRVHVPVTGSIGGIKLNGLPCLLSGPYGDRKTSYTLEAISLDDGKSWIGVNQNLMNAFIEISFKHNLLSNIREVTNANEVHREKKLGDSKIDLRIGNSFFVEVKTPLKYLEIEIPEGIEWKKDQPPPPVERMKRQIKDLTDALDCQKEAAMIAAFAYNAKRFNPPVRNYTDLHEIFEKAYAKGLSNWQVNFELDEEGVKLKDYFKRV